LLDERPTIIVDLWVGKVGFVVIASAFLALWRLVHLRASPPIRLAFEKVSSRSCKLPNKTFALQNQTPCFGIATKLVLRQQIIATLPEREWEQ